MMYGGGRGLVIGKFLPPTTGHEYLINFAASFCDYIEVIVCSKNHEPIPGELRHKWLCETFAGKENVRIYHLESDNLDEPRFDPLNPEGDVEFWSQWRDSILHTLGRFYHFDINNSPIDYVFSSDAYGKPLAKVLGAKRNVPVDVERELIPIDARYVRANPMRYWDYILPAARPYYLKKVCIVGPESTGKSTLVRALAAHYNTKYVHEWARNLTDSQAGKCSFEEIEMIARGQIAAEKAMEKQANRVLFLDTDITVTKVYSKWMFDGDVPRHIEEELERNDKRYDLYLLTEPDVPWVDDGCRFYGDPEQRAMFFDDIRSELKRRALPYTVISGSWRERTFKAIEAVDRLLADQKPYKV